MLDKRCENCRFWLGKASDYASDCVNPELYPSRPPFDKADCTKWQGKASAAPTSAGTDRDIQRALDQWAAYKRALIKGHQP